MAYATQANLVDRFGERELVELTDRAEPPAGAIDAAVVASALADADAVIDSYIVGRYALPLSPVPAVLELRACDIARFLLHGLRATQEVRDRYDDAIAFLKDVSAGKAKLGADDSGAAPASQDLPQMQTADSAFKRDSSRGFI